jgi:hypothetical protein
VVDVYCVAEESAVSIVFHPFGATQTAHCSILQPLLCSPGFYSVCIYTHQIQALSKATSELGVRTEMSEKWELKTGEMQQKIIELEK